MCVYAPAQEGGCAIGPLRSATSLRAIRPKQKKMSWNIRTLRKASPAWVIPERFALFATRQGVAWC